MQRRTLKANTTTIQGLGLFSAQPASLHIAPAPPGTGLAFMAPTRLPVHAANLFDGWRPPVWPAAILVRNTVVLSPPAAAATIEHIVSALAGLGVTDALIVLEGDEVPILDGSALQFVEALRPLMIEGDGTVEPLRMGSTIEVRDETSGSFIRAQPRTRPGISITYTLDYTPSSAFATQSATWHGDPQDYASHIAPARTFSFLHEAKAMQAMGLFTHLTPRDMLVLNPDGSPVDNELRFPHEPARHKLLDLIGDLALLGMPINADITAHRSGHKLTHELCRKLLAHLRPKTARTGISA